MKWKEKNKNQNKLSNSLKEVCFNNSGIDKHNDDAIVVSGVKNYTNIFDKTLERLPVFSNNPDNNYRIIKEK